YRLSRGDVLGIFIDGVLGESNKAPPVLLPEPGTDTPAAVGFPIPVLDDGTISLPYIDPLPVKGRSIAEVQAEIIKAYTVTKQILKVDEKGSLVARVLLSLYKARRYNITVLRQD